jgi:hypothetical protein
MTVLFGADPIPCANLWTELHSNGCFGDILWHTPVMADRSLGT